MRAVLITAILAALITYGASAQDQEGSGGSVDPQQDPVHLWGELWAELKPIVNLPLTKRAEALSKASPVLRAIEELARQQGREDFAYYLAARHAGFYGAYTEAMAAIDRALVLVPNSTYYLFHKANLLGDQGAWRKSDEDIRSSIELFERVRELVAENPSDVISLPLIDFEIAAGYSKLSDPQWEEVARYYRRSIEQQDNDQSLAFAWNNVSIAYRRLGQCQEAKQAAEQALSVFTFGAAKANKRWAEFCLETQQLARK